MSHDGDKGYLFSWPAYQKDWPRRQLYYTQDGWPINGMPDEREATDRRRYAASPVNTRYTRRVAKLVSWREVLEANGYAFINRNRTSLFSGPFKRLAGIRHDSALGEVFYICCVFHEERTSSLCLLPRGFHCFGCGTNGSIVDFVAGINHLTSARAIKDYFATTFPQLHPRTK